MLAVGDIAPATDIPTDTDYYSLAPHNGKKMVIFFFPRADTSGCTKEAIQFSNLVEDFAAAGAEVIGISKDTPKKQANLFSKSWFLAVLALIMTLISVNNLVYGWKNLCMVGLTWAFSGQPLSLILVAKSTQYGKR